MRYAAAFTSVFLFVGACGAPDPTLGGATALFDVPRAGGGGDYYALPFPNDIRVGPDGHIDLSGHERPNPLTEVYLDAIEANQIGFSLNAPVLFRFSDVLDAATLPASPAEAAGDSSAAYIVNIEAGSPRFGERVPALFRFEARDGTVIGPNWLSIVPYPGFPLAENSTYAAVVTTQVRAGDGTEIAPAADFEAMRAGTLDPNLTGAAAIYQPLWDYLDQAGGDERADVVTAAVWTTQDATSVVGKIRDVIYRDVPAPTPSAFALVETQADYALYEGLYDGPIFQRGTVPYARPEDGGDLEIDANGDPVVQAIVSLRFAVSVPLGVRPANGWPIVLYAHGTGGSYLSFTGEQVAATLAREGLAVISIDQTLHGPRNPTGDEETDFFNFQNPLSGRDNTIQGALDDFQLARLVVGFDETIGAETITFDADRIYFFGHSQGGLTGLPFVAFEPLIKGAVFSGAGGNIVQSLLHKTAPIDIASLVKILIRDEPLDEFNPMLGLIQGFLDRSDSVNYGPLIVASPPPGRVAVDVFHSLGLVDTYTPVPAIKALATSLQVDPLEPMLEPIEGLALRGRSPLTVPVTGNLGVTGVVAEYNQALGSDGHFVVFDVPAARAQSVQFLGSLARDGVATVVATE